MAILLSFCSQSRNILVYVVYGRWRVHKNGGTWNPANICLRSLRIRKSLFVSIHCDIRIHDWLVFNVRVIDWSFRGKIQKYRRGKYFFYLKCRNVEFAKRMFYCLMCNIYIYICITCELDASVQALQISMYIVRATGGSDIERFRSQSMKVSFSEFSEYFKFNSRQLSNCLVSFLKCVTDTDWFVKFIVDGSDIVKS